MSEATRSLLHFTSFFLDLKRLKFLGCFGGVGLSWASNALSFVGTKSPDGDDNSKLERPVGVIGEEDLWVSGEGVKRRRESGVVGKSEAVVGARALFSKIDGPLKL